MSRTSPESLFRRAALVAMNNRPIGRAICPVPPAWTWITTIVVFAFTVLLVLAPHIEWHRTEAVRGWLVPAAGIVRVTSPASGVVAVRAVEVGQRVGAGDVLAVIATEVHNADGTSRRHRDRRLLTAAIEESYSRETLLDQRNAVQLNKVQVRVDLLASELDSIDRQLDSERQRHDIEAQLLKKLSAAAAAITKVDFLRQQESLLARSSAIEGLSQRRSHVEGELSTLLAEIDAIPIDTKIAKSELFAERKRLQKQLADSESEIALVAPVSGRIADTLLSEGDAVTPGATLISILPSTADLRAELHVPSKSSAYLRVGQSVKLFIDAWPREKFGAIDGTVDQISEFVSATGNDLIARSYRVVVRFDATERPLRPGMSLGAELLLERRNLVDWLIGPLRSRLSS